MLASQLSTGKRQAKSDTVLTPHKFAVRLAKRLHDLRYTIGSDADGRSWGE